jgi:Tfp pilus assembly protein PilN
MIKINLLGVAAPAPRAAAAAPATKAMQLGTFIVAMVVCFAIVGLCYKIWSGSIDTLNVELGKQRAEQARLAAIKAENVQYEQQRRLLEQRINTIQMLQTSRVGPTDLMNTLGNVVNKTSDLYLFSMTPQSDRLEFHGQANSVNSVATFVYAMKTSGYFEDVQLRQFYQDDVENRVSYKFNVDCAYKSPLAAASATPAGTGAGPGTAAGASTAPGVRRQGM